MSHLLWKYYWENDVDKFRRLLAPAGQSHIQPSPRSSAVGPGSWGHSPSAPGPGTSPRTSNKSRKFSGFAGAPGSAKGNAFGLGKAEVNSRDHAGLTVLLRAAASRSPSALDFVCALLDHSAIDLHVQDPESGWNALHRALYNGNISIARLLLEKERRLLMEQTSGGAVAKVGELIKTKDNEGNSPFDLYNSTIATRMLKQVDMLDDSASASESEADSEGDANLAASIFPLDGVTEADEIFMFGSNKNLSLGVGDEDDRQFPERVVLNRPAHLLRRFFDEYLENAHHDSAEARDVSSPDSSDLSCIPALTKFKPLRIQDAVLSKFHSAILTADPVSNLHLSGVGRSGRLGLGDENTQFRFMPVQGGLADKKVVQVALGLNHTMALTDNGELWTWGSNGNAQLGYALPPARKDEEPMTTSPRQVFGSLKKETILGIAASGLHSVVRTSSALFCWGRNVGQLGLMDADSRSLEVQVTPRKVAVSLFSANIAAVSAIDKATTCLLDDSSVCVFTSYGYNFVKFPMPDVFANQQFTPRSMSSKYDGARNAIKTIASGGETIAAVTARGDLFTVSLNQKAESTSSATSTTNPAKIKGALTSPSCIWSARKDGVRSVSVGEHGSVIICTESGAVWRRIKRAKAKDARPGSAATKRSDFKFQRVPSVTRVMAVRSSTFGTFAAIRKDSDVMREQIYVDSQSLHKDLAPLLSLRGFQASEPNSGDKNTLKFWDADELRQRLGELPYQLLKSPNIDDDVKKFLENNSFRHSGQDVLLCSTSSPEILIPAHRWILAARSSVMRCAFTEYSEKGEFAMPETFSMQERDGKAHITFQSLDLLSLVNLMVFCYDDVVVPAWNFTRQAPPLAYRYRQVRVEVMKLASKLHIAMLESASRLQTTAEKSLDRDMGTAILDPKFFEDADAVVEVNGDELPVHSQLLRQRCTFFEGLFHGRTGGAWLTGRQDIEEDEGQIRIDLQHVDAGVFHYVKHFLYADAGIELFDDAVASDLDDFSDLVLQVMSIANELMLDRLSQICQRTLGQFVTTRNISILLNEISPCSVTEFKDAGLEYVCLQMETMLENHFLDDLDEDLLDELDEVVRQNQLARSPFVRSGRAELLHYETNPDLTCEIEEERRIRVKEMAFKASQKDEEKKLSSSFRAKVGSLDDIAGSSPAQDRPRRRSKAGRNEPFSPSLRPQESHGDCIFDMDEDGSSTIASPVMFPEREAMSGKGSIDVIRPMSLAASVKDSTERPIAGLTSSPVPDLLLPATGSEREAQQRSLDGKSQDPGSAMSSPWGAAALPTSKMDLRAMLTPTPPKSALSARLAAQKAQDSSPKTSQPKMSQKERKRQQAQVAAQAAQAAEEKQPKTAWDTQGSASKAAPWKVVSSGAKSSMKDLLSKEGSQTPASAAKAKPLVVAESISQSIPRRTASPDTRYSGQSRGKSSPSVPTTTSSTPSKPPAKPLMPHSRSYMTPAPKAEPALGLSLTDIIGQQRREQEVVKEAVAKRSMQEIQQEQEFQEWWDQESRRIQEEEARRAAKGSGREDKDKGQRGGKRGRRARGGKGSAEGAGGGRAGPRSEGDAGASSAGVANQLSSDARGRGGRSRGGKVSAS